MNDIENALTYLESNRSNNYPPIEDYVDAVVKDDAEAIKTKYPKGNNK